MTIPELKAEFRKRASRPGSTAICHLEFADWLAALDAAFPDAITPEYLRSLGWFHLNDHQIRSPLQEDGEEGRPWTLIFSTTPTKWEPRWSLSFPGCQSGLGYDLTTREELLATMRVLRIPVTAEAK